MKTVSIVIPAYNEEAFIGTLLERIQAVRTEALGFRKEIIVVDDGSTDGTSERAGAFSDVRLIRQNNQGKGAAVQRGIQLASGDYVLVQDADLEYDPQDYVPMLSALKNSPRKAIYGSRPLGVIRSHGWSLLPGKAADQALGPWAVNVVLLFVTWALYRVRITDMLTGYKVYPTDVIRSFTVKTSGFETDHEITSKLIKSKVRIEEVPISYAPRSVAEGKKIRPRDGLVALWTLLKYRLVD